MNDENIARPEWELVVAHNIDAGALRDDYDLGELVPMHRIVWMFHPGGDIERKMRIYKDAIRRERRSLRVVGFSHDGSSSPARIWHRVISLPRWLE